MQTADSVAGVVRLQPGSEGAEDAATKKGRGQQQLDAYLQEREGAKGRTLQTSADKVMQQFSNAGSSGSLMDPKLWRLPLQISLG